MPQSAPERERENEGSKEQEPEREQKGERGKQVKKRESQEHIFNDCCIKCSSLCKRTLFLLLINI